MSNKFVSFLFYLCFATVIAILFFFIVYNAEWLVGDDAIIIRQTGWGHAIDPSNSISPASGRFFPLSYIVYDIAWLLGLTSAQSHFAIVAVFFVCSSILILILGQKSVGKFHSKIRYIIVFAFLMIGVQRIYSNHLDLYSTVWFGYFVILLWCLCCYYVSTQQSVMAAIIGFLLISYLCYCGENVFVYPLSYGTAGLLFSWHRISKLEKVYFCCLIGTSILFLLLYLILIFPYIETAYSGDHGEGVTLIGNAFRQLLAQKLLLFGLVVLAIRLYRIFMLKDKYEFWDTMILTGFSYCVGCAILKLNWTLYYSSAAIFMLPAIAHYLIKYMGNKFSAVVFVCLALFMCRKMPQTIMLNQQARLSTTHMMSVVKKEYSKGNAFYWLESLENRHWCFDLEQRRWKKESLQTQIGWEVGNENFRLNEITDFAGDDGVYVLIFENNMLYPNYNDSVISCGQIIFGENTDRTFTLVRVPKDVHE